MIYWIFGLSGSGKTTLSDTLKRGLEDEGHTVVQLDGDALRTVWCDLGFDKRSRVEQNTRAALLARILEAQGLTVIISTICPYRQQREALSKLASPRWIYLPGGEDRGDGFEPPG